MLQWLPGAGQSLSSGINSAEHNPHLQLNVMLQTAEQLTALTCLITPNKLKVFNLTDSLPLLLDSQASIFIASTVKVTKGFS